MTWDDLPRATVWTFGFSCVDLSVAGKGAGMIVKCGNCDIDYDPADSVGGACPLCGAFGGRAVTRSGTFFEIMRLLDETALYASESLPTFLVAENVKGLKRYLPVLQREYESRGYTMHYALYNSKYWGVPQSRERYYVVGVKADAALSAPFAMPVEDRSYVPKLSSVLEDSVDERYYLSDDKAQKIIEAALAKASLTSGVTTGSYGKTRGFIARDVSPTLDACAYKGLGSNQDRRAVVEIAQSVFTDKDDCAYCCDANYAKGVSPDFVGTGRRTHIVEGASAFRVRRLTPTEYGRLQNFPMDRWRQVVSNSQSYKQFGNAVTTTVAQAVAVSIRDAIGAKRIHDYRQQEAVLQ